MAEYSSWKPVVDIERVRQDQRKRAPFGRDPKASDPYVDDAYMVTRQAPKTKLDLPPGNAVARGIAPFVPVDPSNVPVTPAQVRKAQNGAGGPTGIQPTAFNDALLEQDLHDKRAWTASTEDAPGTATVAQWNPKEHSFSENADRMLQGGISALSNSAGAPPTFMPATREAWARGGEAIDAAKTFPGKLHESFARYASLVPALGNDIFITPAKIAADVGAPILFGEASAAEPSTPKQAQTEKALASPSEDLTGVIPTGSYIRPEPSTAPVFADVGRVRASSLPRIARESREAGGPVPLGQFALTNENLAQARADAQNTPVVDLQTRLNELEGATAAFKETNQARTNVADGFAPDAVRSKDGGVFGKPSMDDALEDYAAGRAGSTGYGMIRNLRMKQEGDFDNAVRAGAKAAPDSFGGIPGLTQKGKSGELSDALALLNYQRGVASDQRREKQDNFSNMLQMAGLSQKAATEQRQAQEGVQRETRLANKDFDANAEKYAGSFTGPLAWAAPYASTYFSQAKGKYKDPGEAVQALAGTMQFLTDSKEPAFTVNNQPFSEGDAVKLLTGQHDWNSSWSLGPGSAVVEDAKRKAAQYIQARALGAARGT